MQLPSFLPKSGTCRGARMSWVGRLLLEPGPDVLARYTNVHQWDGFVPIPRARDFDRCGMDSKVEGNCRGFRIR